MPNPALSTTEIRAIFDEEIHDAGGFNSDTFDDGERLFARSILSWHSEVRPRDEMKGGVALRAAECDVSVHPYLFRQVCTNGAIVAQSIQTRRVENSDIFPREGVESELREAVRACCLEEAFTGAVRDVRMSVDREIDTALSLLPLISRLPSAHASELFQQIVFRFFQEADRSRFALMNAVTSVARDTRDPELRWRLEELGGGIPVVRIPTPSLDPADDFPIAELAGQVELSATEFLVGSARVE